MLKFNVQRLNCPFNSNFIFSYLNSVKTSFELHVTAPLSRAWQSREIWHTWREAGHASLVPKKGETMKIILCMSKKCCARRIRQIYFVGMWHGQSPAAIALLKHQFPFDHWSLATLGLVSTWMGDSYPSAAGAVAELSWANSVLWGWWSFLPSTICMAKRYRKWEDRPIR